MKTCFMDKNCQNSSREFVYLCLCGMAYLVDIFACVAQQGVCDIGTVLLFHAVSLLIMKVKQIK